ncbi:MAG TPA: nucleotidyltransferase family protein [Candidatus Kapabacteria bacterium]|nr:nucleotidyltransferase family protein [Candidatus Kapabacteria bacterium]
MRDLTFNPRELENLCNEYHVRRLAVFGSVLAGHEHPESDLDLLVEFDPANGPGWDMFKLEDRLSKLFHRTVDLNTPGFISRYFRDEVMRSAQNLYVR